jgi:energy-converting hydrogenase Eha subunit H
MDYVVHCFKDFNLLQFFLSVIFIVFWTKTNTNKEIKTLSEQVQSDAQEVKMELNHNVAILMQAICIKKGE